MRLIFRILKPTNALIPSTSASEVSHFPKRQCQRLKEWKLIQKTPSGLLEMRIIVLHGECFSIGPWQLAQEASIFVA